MTVLRLCLRAPRAHGVSAERLRLHLSAGVFHQRTRKRAERRLEQLCLHTSYVNTILQPGRRLDRLGKRTTPHEGPSRYRHGRYIDILSSASNAGHSATPPTGHLLALRD